MGLGVCYPDMYVYAYMYSPLMIMACGDAPAPHAAGPPSGVAVRPVGQGMGQGRRTRGVTRGGTGGHNRLFPRLFPDLLASPDTWS